MGIHRHIDRTDRQILRHLRQDARLSNKSLAGRVGLAASTCLGRVQSLIADGVLRGFHAEVDAASLGVRLQAMLAVRLAHHTQSEVEAFREYVLALDEVVQFYHVAGPVDFLIHVWVSDAQTLRELVMNAFVSRAEVEHVETELIFEHAQSHALPEFDTPERRAEP